MVYHGDNKESMTAYFSSEGTCTDPKANPCQTQLGSDGVFVVKYDEASSNLVMNAVIPDGSYAGWGWGASMTNTEMVIFSANGDSSSASTYYSTGHSEP